MTEGPWAEISRVCMKDLHLLIEAAQRGDESPIPSGSVTEAADRLVWLVEVIALLDQLDQTDEKNVATVNAILFYIGYRAGKLADRLPFHPKITEIQLPSRHILALIQGDKTLNEVLAEVDEEL